MEKDIITSVQFVGSNGKSITIPHMKVHVGPGPEDCDMDLSPILEAVVINLLEKADLDALAKKKEAHHLKHGSYNPEHQTFYTVEIEDILVSKRNWIDLSMVPSCLMDNYTD